MRQQLASVFKHLKQNIMTRLNLLLLGSKKAWNFKHPLDAEAEESKLQTEWKRQLEEDSWTMLD